MLLKKYVWLQRWLTLTLLISIGILTVACGASSGSSGEQPIQQGIQTRLLVRAPDPNNPEERLVVNKPVEVISLTEDQAGVSHVELYAISLPNGQANVLLNTALAPSAQTSFTASQSFIPVQAGRYEVRVVGYNLKGNKAESEALIFEVAN